MGAGGHVLVFVPRLTLGAAEKGGTHKLVVMATVILSGTVPIVLARPMVS